MRLIDADRLYNTIIDEIDPISISMDGGEMRGMMRTIIAAEPTVPAVPLDKLCEWLSNHAGRPIDCQDHLCGKCEFDDVGVGQEMCWKALITKWMEEEEHNGTDDP